MLIAEAILGVLMGGAFAAAWLAVKTVTVADAPPKVAKGETPERHAVVYVSGRESPLRQSQWQRKQRSFLEKDPKGVELQEQDVNRWVATEFGKIDLTSKWESLNLEYRGGLPNFRFDGERVIIGAIGNLKAFGLLDRKVVVQASGSFEPRNGMFRFVPGSMLIGALPVPFEFLRNKIGEWVVGSLTASDSFLDGWKALADIKVEQSRMKVGFPQPEAVVETPPVVSPESTTDVPDAVTETASETPGDVSETLPVVGDAHAATDSVVADTPVDPAGEQGVVAPVPAETTEPAAAEAPPPSETLDDATPDSATPTEAEKEVPAATDAPPAAAETDALEEETTGPATAPGV